MADDMGQSAPSVLKYLSVCSGIEAATVAWHPLGFRPLAFSEIEPFPRAVLAHHYPHVPLHGDFTRLRDEDWIGDADILVGGCPCQAFSIAGLRNSLDDARGNSFRRTFRFKGSDGVAVDLTGSVLMFVIEAGAVRLVKSTADDTLAMPDPASGEVVLNHVERRDTFPR